MHTRNPASLKVQARTGDLPDPVHTGNPASLRVQARKCIAVNAAQLMSVQGRDHVKFMRRLQFLGTGITGEQAHHWPPSLGPSRPLPRHQSTRLHLDLNAQKPVNAVGPGQPLVRSWIQKLGNWVSGQTPHRALLSWSPQPAGHPGPAPSSTSAPGTQQDPRGLPR